MSAASSASRAAASRACDGLPRLLSSSCSTTGASAAAACATAARIVAVASASSTVEVSGSGCSGGAAIISSRLAISAL